MLCIFCTNGIIQNHVFPRQHLYLVEYMCAGMWVGVMHLKNDLKKNTDFYLESKTKTKLFRVGFFEEWPHRPIIFDVIK